MKQSVFVLFLCLSQIALGQDIFPVSSTHSSTKETVEIKVKTIDGKSHLLKDLLSNGKNHVISIMASWCGPCRIELDHFQKVHEEWANELNTDIIAISIDKPTDSKKLFDLVTKSEWGMQVVHDDMGYTARELVIFGIPQTFLVNTEGEIVYRSKGFKVNIVDKFEREIKKL